MAKKDVRSVTGANLRHIMLLCNRNLVSDLIPDDALNIKYHEPPAEELWRLGVLDELLEVQYGDLTVPGFNDEELSMMQSYIYAQLDNPSNQLYKIQLKLLKDDM